MSERADMWADIEAAALEQVRAELERDERTPLVFGSPIVWSECLMGRTNGMSQLHRVGLPQHGYEYTTCGQLIPPPIRWVPLSPATIRVAPKCKQCEAEVLRISPERAA